MTNADKYQAMLYKVENTDYTNEQLYELSKKLLKILINKEEADDGLFDLSSSIYQREEETHGN